MYNSYIFIFRLLSLLKSLNPKPFQGQGAHQSLRGLRVLVPGYGRS